MGVTPERNKRGHRARSQSLDLSWELIACLLCWFCGNRRSRLDRCSLDLRCWAWVCHTRWNGCERRVPDHALSIVIRTSFDVLHITANSSCIHSESRSNAKGQVEKELHLVRTVGLIWLFLRRVQTSLPFLIYLSTYPHFLSLSLQNVASII